LVDLKDHQNNLLWSHARSATKPAETVSGATPVSRNITPHVKNLPQML